MRICMEQQIENIDVTSLAKELLTNEDSSIRRNAAEQLGASDSFTAIAALANALRDENKGVRDAAQRSLLSIGNEHVAAAVVDYLIDTNITTRNSAAEILIKLGTCSINAVLPFLYDADHDVRKFAVDILGFIGDSSPVEHLLPLLNDPDDNVVISVVEALGNMRSQHAVKDLMRIYERREDCKAAVAEALGKIGGDEASDFLLQKFCEQVLDTKSDQLLLYTLLEALGSAGNKKAVTILREQVGILKGKLRSLLLHALVQICNRYQNGHIDWNQYKQYLLEALSADELPIQESAIQALNTIPDDDITYALLLALGNNDETDNMLISLLPQRHHFLKAVVNIMAQGEFKISKSFLLALQQYLKTLTYAHFQPDFINNDGQALPQLSKLLGEQWHSADEETRPLIIELLFRIDGDRAAEFLIDITEYPDPWLKMQVIELLGPVSDRRATEFLFRFLNDEDEMVRQLTVSVLELKGYSGEVFQTPKAEV